MIKIAIKSHRERIGITQKELANELNVTEDTIANWENERANKINFLRTIALCMILDCKPSDLI